MKTDYMQKAVNDNAKDPKGLFKIINNLLGRNQQCPLPPDIPEQRMAEGFSEFFRNKISNIRLLFSDSTNDHMHTPENVVSASFSNFTALTEPGTKKCCYYSIAKEDRSGLHLHQLPACVEYPFLVKAH